MRESKWTPEKIILLRKFYNTAMTSQEIADRLGDGITRSAVIGKANRMGLSAWKKA